jgi:hypothetical protein
MQGDTILVTIQLVWELIVLILLDRVVSLIVVSVFQNNQQCFVFVGMKASIILVTIPGQVRVMIAAGGLA